MSKDIVDLVWEALQDDILALTRRVTTLEQKSERAEVAGGVAKLALLANAPLAANAASSGDLLFIQNARKVGEGGGAGTGTLCYFNGPTNSWYRASDDTAAAI